MSQDLMNILQQYVKELQKLYGSGLSAVILYGSYARGDFRADSDIDIMILLDMTDEEISQRGHILPIMSSLKSLIFQAFSNLLPHINRAKSDEQS